MEARTVAVYGGHGLVSERGRDGMLGDGAENESCVVSEKERDGMLGGRAQGEGDCASTA